MISLIGYAKMTGRAHSPNLLLILELCLEALFSVPYLTITEGMILA